MIGLGTIINTAAVIIGGLIGILFKSHISDRLCTTLKQAIGIAVIFLGITGTVSKMLVNSGDGFSTQGTMLLIISLVAGGFLGELIDIEKRMDNMGKKLQKLTKSKDDNSFVEGFVGASLIICVGAMAIIGSIEDGLTGNYTTLLAKSVLDFIMLIIICSTYGIGGVFSAVPLFLYQGAITLIAALCGNIVSETLMSNLSLVGNSLICCVGINIVFGKKIKVGNLLPALIIPVIYDIYTNIIK